MLLNKRVFADFPSKGRLKNNGKRRLGELQETGAFSVRGVGVVNIETWASVAHATPAMVSPVSTLKNARQYTWTQQANVDGQSYTGLKKTKTLPISQTRDTFSKMIVTIHVDITFLIRVYQSGERTLYHRGEIIWGS